MKKKNTYKVTAMLPVENCGYPQPVTLEVAAYGIGWISHEDGGKLDEPTTPAPTPWEVKEGYWYEQYQLMRERYNRQIGKNTKQAERIVQLEAALDAMVEGVARKTDSKQADRIRELEEHSSKQDFLIDELADSLRAMVAHCEGFISNLKEGK